MNVQLIQPDSIDASSPNNTRGTAVDLGTGDKSLQNLNIHDRSADVDYFKWTATTNGKLTVDANFRHADGDLVLAVEDANGVELTTSDDKVDNERVTLNVYAGSDYFIKVTAVRPEPGGAAELQPAGGLWCAANDFQYSGRTWSDWRHHARQLHGG